MSKKDSGLYLSAELMAKNGHIRRPCDSRDNWTFNVDSDMRDSLLDNRFSMITTGSQIGVKRILIVMEFILMFLSFIVMYIFEDENIVKATHQMVSCDNREIFKPYRFNTISALDMVLVSFFLVITVGYVGEYVYYKCTSRSVIAYVNINGCNVPSWFWHGTMFWVMGWYILGWTMTIPSMIKLFVGELRPNFMAVCEPSLLTECNLKGYHEQKDICDYDKFHSYYSNASRLDDVSIDLSKWNKERWLSKLEQSRRSFPSGHSSLGAVTSWFMILYVFEWFKRFEWHRTVSCTLCVVTLFIGGLFLAVSRIGDHMHHSNDVVAGYAFGVLTALVAYKLIVLPTIAASLGGHRGRPLAHLDSGAHVDSATPPPIVAGTTRKYAPDDDDDKSPPSTDSDNSTGSSNAAAQAASDINGSASALSSTQPMIAVATESSRKKI